MAIKKLWALAKNEAVLSVAALLAFVSMFFVPPDRGYLGYVDWQVPALLFCLMAVVAGLRDIGVFSALGGFMARRVKSPRRLMSALVLLCFFTAPLITNDVALITFVPFTVALLGGGDGRRLIMAIVVETVAANLGSMITPIGNPQNLYIYSHYSMSAGEFFAAVLPLGAVCLVLCAALAALIPPGQAVRPPEDQSHIPVRAAVRYLALFALCILTVLKLLPWYGVLAATVVCLLIFDRRLFRRVDWGLLATFLCFFVFVGNISRLDAVKELLSRLIEGRVIPVAALSSQLISNVPAATLLAAFTADAPALLTGVNIGGLGTPIASMASLISYRLYCASPAPQRGRYLAVFSAVNFALLALLLAGACLINI